MSKDDPAVQLKQIQDCYTEIQKVVAQMAAITEQANKDMKACLDKKAKYEAQVADLLKV